MPKTSPRQRKTTGRVMHEFKHGELRSGPGGKGGKVKSRRQAIAIALNEAGVSKYESDREKKKNFAKTERKEARGETYQQEREREIACLRSRPPRKQPRHGWAQRGQDDRARPQGRAVASAPSGRYDETGAVPAREGARHRRPFKNEQAATRERAALGRARGGWCRRIGRGRL